MARSEPKSDTFSAMEKALLQIADELKTSPSDIQAEFLAAADRGSDADLYMLLQTGAEIDTPDKRTGLTALHLVVGRDSIQAARFLIDQGAKFLPDAFGRMPSTVAAECEVSEAMCDLIAEAEAKAEAKFGGV